MCLLSECMNARPCPQLAHSVTHLTCTKGLVQLFDLSADHIC